MTPAALKAARKTLGLTQAEFAHLVIVATGRTVRKWEDEERDIPGPVERLVDVLLNVPEARRYLGLPDADLRT